LAPLAQEADPLRRGGAVPRASSVCTAGRAALESLRVSAASVAENSSPPDAESLAAVFKAVEELCGFFA
jgi:hypothetical protein